MTWFEPTPSKTASDPNEALTPGFVQVYEGSSVTLKWSYNLSLGLGLGGVIRFKTDAIFNIKADGSATPVMAQFQERFTATSTPGRTSLIISPVSVSDDKLFGEFRCELLDSIGNLWKRAIRVQVIGKLESVADYKKGVILAEVYCYPVLPSGPSLNAGRT